MSNASIVDLVERMVPRFLDSSGKSPDKAPGMVMGIVTRTGSEVIGFGTAQLGRDRKPDGDTYFGIGSVTKIFTGFVLAKAVTDGLVDLDGSVNAYLKQDLRVMDDGVTMRHLVTHTSGLPDFFDNLKAFRDSDNDGRNVSDRTSPGRNYTRKQLAECLKVACESAFEPGAREQYSNLGTGLLSLALQDTLGFGSFETMNRAFITGPLNMANTATNTTEMRSKALSRQAQGYAAERGVLKAVPYSDMGVLEGSGELVSTANDMIRLLRAVTGVQKTRLSPVFQEALRPLSSVRGSEMAYGFKIKKSSDGGSIYGKSGETSGYSALIIWRTDPKIGIMLMANRGKFNPVNRMGLNLIEAVAGNISR